MYDFIGSWVLVLLVVGLFVVFGACCGAFATGHFIVGAALVLAWTLGVAAVMQF